MEDMDMDMEDMDMDMEDMDDMDMECDVFSIFNCTLLYSMSWSFLAIGVVHVLSQERYSYFHLADTPQTSHTPLNNRRQQTPTDTARHTQTAPVSVLGCLLASVGMSRSLERP